MKKLVIIMALVLVSIVAGHADAASVAIVEGSFWTSNLADNLTARGETVTTIDSYTAASLSAYDAVIHYGNSFTDHTALEEYVNSGGILIETPWYQSNQNPPASLQMWSCPGSDDQYHITYPGVVILDPGNLLLSGVSFPAGPGGFDIGREGSTAWVGGVNQITNWADSEVMIGTKSLGAGTIVGINMHVITSDTAYEVIDQPWATQLFVNAVNIPEPTTIALLGFGGLTLLRRKRSAR